MFHIILGFQMLTAAGTDVTAAAAAAAAERAKWPELV